MREQIARVIDPEAWDIGDRYPSKPAIRRFCRNRSLAKADAILSLLNRKTNDE
jgi:hypothetical protein